MADGRTFEASGNGGTSSWASAGETERCLPLLAGAETLVAAGRSIDGESVEASLRELS